MNHIAPTSGALRLASYTPDSGTVELPRVQKGRLNHELATVELDLLDLHPPDLTPAPLSARLLALWLRILASPFAEHLREARRSTFAPAVVGALILLAVVIANYVAAGWFVTTDGFNRIPIDGLGR